jgi:hypothetical protein
MLVRTPPRIVPGAVRRAFLFAAYALLGAVLSYGVLFQPFTFAIVVVAGLVALPRPRALEAMGLLAGPGLFLLLAAQTTGDAALGAAGAVIVAAALVAYTLAGRARCTRLT